MTNVISQFVAILAAGIATGICSGFFGIGGGIILVPMLVLLFKFPQHTANGISLVALLAPVGALGAWEYFRAGKIDMMNVKYGFMIAIGIFAGAYIGSRIAVDLEPRTLTRIFSVFLALVSIRLWFT